MNAPLRFQHFYSRQKKYKLLDNSKQVSDHIMKRSKQEVTFCTASTKASVGDSTEPSSRKIILVNDATCEQAIAACGKISRNNRIGSQSDFLR